MTLFEKIFGKKTLDEVIPQEESNYNELLEDCLSEVREKNLALVEEYEFGSHDRWDLDQEIGDLEFSHEGELKLVCGVVLLGTYSFISKTWLWGWANESLYEKLTKETLKVKEYGESQNVMDLVHRKTEATETEAWALGSYACRILNGKGIYKGPSDNGFTLMMITSLHKP